MWLSMAGMYAFDNTVFDGLVIPEGVDKNTLVFNLLAETAELELLYPDGNFMKKSLEMWSKKELPVWNKLYATTILDYNPIENYDRIEEWEDKNIGSATSSVAAFNAAELVDSAGGKTDTTGTHKGRTHGNIGVTTTQQMLEQERKTAEFNIIDYITQSFKRRFCVMVY